LGCGAGRPIDRFLIDKGHKIIGIDISKKQIELAKKNVPEARYTIKDISDLKKGEYQVDAVVSFYVILHIPRETQEELFEKIYSFLPKDGLALVTMASLEFEGIKDFYGVKMYWSHYGPEKNRQVIEKSGFEVILDEIESFRREKHQVILARKIG
jgi:cyclopropane fatty-acyl-phospholipid synthase-like methyltransferase